MDPHPSLSPPMEITDGLVVAQITWALCKDSAHMEGRSSCCRNQCSFLCPPMLGNPVLDARRKQTRADTCARVPRKTRQPGPPRPRTTIPLAICYREKVLRHAFQPSPRATASGVARIRHDGESLEFRKTRPEQTQNIPKTRIGVSACVSLPHPPGRRVRQGEQMMGTALTHGWHTHTVCVDRWGALRLAQCFPPSRTANTRSLCGARVLHRCRSWWQTALGGLSVVECD